jgi:serine O-acetyltransferase
MEDETLIEKLISNNKKLNRKFLDKKSASNYIDGLFELLFVCHPDIACNKGVLEANIKALEETLAKVLLPLIPDANERTHHVKGLNNALPGIYDSLLKDAQAILTTDPAANSIDEVVTTYPGFFATAVYRISHQLFKQNLIIVARFFAEYAHSKTGIDIHPGASIGESFAIDHGTGIVIGETTVIGNNVKIYQGVTLGALNVSKDQEDQKRHPTIEEGVIIYAGATILGGDTTIGSGSIIGGNVWLTYSVPPNSVVYHKSEIHVKDNNPFPEPLNFVI